MSRIGKKPIVIPQGVTINVDNNLVSVKGPKGNLTFQHHLDVAIEITPENILVEKIGKGKNAPAIWGTTARIIGNMFESWIQKTTRTQWCWFSYGTSWKKNYTCTWIFSSGGG